MGFSWKKSLIFFKSLKVANLRSNGYQILLFLKNVFSPVIEIFFRQNVRSFLKFENLKNMKERFSKKKRQKFSSKNRKAENILVVAGSLVKMSRQNEASETKKTVCIGKIYSLLYSQINFLCSKLNISSPIGQFFLI